MALYSFCSPSENIHRCSLNFTASKIAQGMQHKANLDEEAELTQMSATSRPRILSQDLTLPNKTRWLTL